MKRLTLLAVSMLGITAPDRSARAQEEPAEWTEATADEGGPAEKDGEGRTTIEELYEHPRAGHEAIKVGAGDFTLSVNLNAQV
ncbi:MAG: hypothetical protein FJ109_13860, partial [Deltaproteobacteria bacterium]|nr:hypothetical protein [Deltaproteobacteria bacterium]